MISHSATARAVVKHLQQLDILQEITGKKRDQVYIYKKYLSLLEYGAEPIKPA